MDIADIVERINNGEKIVDISETLEISRGTLSKKIKDAGYVYNNKTKVHEFVGKTSEELQRNVRKDSDKKKVKLEEKSELALTEEEINFVKSSYKRRNHAFSDKNFEVAWEKAHLPSRKPEKKTPYIISDKTFEEFKAFSSELENEFRVTQNELVEIALRKLMNDWAKLGKSEI